MRVDLMNLLKQTGCVEKLELSLLVKMALLTENGYYAHQSHKQPATLLSHHILK